MEKLGGKKIILALIVILAVVPKLFWLDRIPVGLAHDEAIYAINAVSYKDRGSDLSGFGLPLSLFRSETEGGITPVAPNVYALFYSFFPTNQFAIHFAMVVVNLITSLIFYKIIKSLTKNYLLAYISLIFFLISPWSYFLARWAVDTPWALLFYLTGSYLLLEAKSKKILTLSATSFLLGFFSYHGAKLIYLPLILIISYYKFGLIGAKGNKEKYQIKVFATVALAFFAVYLATDFILPGGKIAGRSKDLVFTSSHRFEDTVNVSRKNTLENRLNEALLNKPTAILETIAEKYMTAFSPDVLFFSGDTRATYRYEYHGLLYLIDFVFILSGLFYLFSNNRKLFNLFASLAIIAPIATSVGATDTSVANRSFMLLPVMIFFSSYGAYIIIEKCQKKYRYTATALLFLLISISYVKFLHFYYYRLPITSQENYFLTDKIIAGYVNLSNQGSKIIIVNTTPRATFLENIFYLDKSSGLMESLGNRKLISEDYRIKDLIMYTDSCPLEIEDNVTYIVSRESNCVLPKHDAEIIDQKDAGQLYRIVNDSLCGNENLDIYRRLHRIEDYKIFDLNTEDFCTKWISSPKV